MTSEVTQDGTSQTEPTPSTIWGGEGYSAHYVEDISERPDPRLPWCVTVEGVGSWPIAWFYQRADAENYVRLVAESDNRAIDNKGEST